MAGAIMVMNSTTYSNPSPQPPAAPTLVSPIDSSKVSSSSVTFQWNSSSGATNYQIRVSTDPNVETPLFHENTTGGATSKNYTNFPNDGTVYYWKVRAYNNVGWGAWSIIWYFDNGDVPETPPAPVLISPTNDSTVSSTSVTFQWNSSSGATNYQIRVSTDPDVEDPLFHDDTTGGAISKNYTDFPNDGTVYYWKVRAYNAVGWGDWSTIWYFHNGDVSAIWLTKGDMYRYFDFKAGEVKLFKFRADSGPSSPILSVVTEVQSCYSHGYLHMMVKYAGQDWQIGPPTAEDYAAILAIIEEDPLKYKGIYNGIYYFMTLHLTKRIYIKYPEQITDGCWYLWVKNIGDFRLDDCMVHFNTR